MRISIIILTLIAFSSICQGEDKSHPYYWFQAHTDSIYSVIIDTSKNADTILSRAFLSWKRRDGAIFIEICYFIGPALVFRPAKMLKYFAKDTAEFAEFLLDLPDAMFTDYNGNEKDKLENMRLRIISSLDKLIANKSGDRNIRNIAKKLLTRIKSITVHVVD
ncbi:MAG TPA: hypothetical protein VLX68_01585 [Chitinivibrionales bacterium]|nr:hypothetical protein [Chitinivibrionales bacterium]